MSRLNYFVLALLVLSREALSSSLDQFPIDDLDQLSIGEWQDLPTQPGAHDLVLLPRVLQFARTPLAHLESHEVTIYNHHSNKTVYVNSIFPLPLEDGPHNDFHVPFVRDQAIPPQGNFTVRVVFLPTRIGTVQTEILVRTSFGQLKYHVQGIGVASPFKVVPLTHLVSYAGVNSNAAIIPDIVLYNPYEVPIQITEIISSGGKFYLELPTVQGTSTAEPVDSAQEDLRTQLWTIGAYEKRQVIRVRFVGSLVAGNYSAYIRMKIKALEELAEETTLNIPIRMTVKPAQPLSLYPERSMINLGSVLLHEKRPLNINIHTLDTPEIGVSSLTWDSQLAVGEVTTRFRRLLDCSDIVVGEEQLVRLKIECDLGWPDVLGNVTDRVSGTGSVMHISGGVLVNLTVGADKSKQVHEIPLFAELISGSGVELPQNVTVLFPRPDQVDVSLFFMRNNFETPIVIRGLQLVAKEGYESTLQDHVVYPLLMQHFLEAAASDFPKVLRPGESWTMGPAVLSRATLEGSANEMNLKSFMAYLQIETNVTEVIKVPLFGYTGKLTRLILSPDVRSVLSGKSKGSAAKDLKVIQEENASEIDFGSVRLDVEAHQYVALLNDNPVPIELLQWDLPAMDLLMSIFNVGCMNKMDFGQNKDTTMQPDDWCVFTFSATTSRAGAFNGTFLYQTPYERGQFPIRIQGDSGSLNLDAAPMVMRNCFPKSVCQADIIVESTYSDTVFVQDILPHKDASVHILTREILPNAKTKIGIMQYNPGSSRNEASGYINTYPNNIFDSTNDQGLFVLQSTAVITYRRLMDRPFQLPFQLVTDRQRISSSVAVNLVWPRLIDREVGLADHLLMVGKTSSYNITIHNPSEESIAYSYYLHDDRLFISRLMDTPLYYPTEPLMYYLAHEAIQLTDNGADHKYVLRPHETKHITVQMDGKRSARSASTMFVLRNNFTFFEGAWLRLKIVQPQFKFGNRKPMSTTPLLFEIPDQPNECQPGQAATGDDAEHRNLISTRRTFTAKNTGEQMLIISKISINSEPCSGHGFTVINCTPFVLRPNATHKVEIAFVPDFTVARIEKKIVFEADVDFPIHYTLVGVVPPSMLSRCRDSVPRPWWEASLRKWSFTMLVGIGVIVASVAVLEAMKILKDHSDAMYRQRGPFQAPLDFKKLTAMKMSTSSASGGAETATTKEPSVKAPKKKTPPSSTTSTLFNHKRFSWFINRSQMAAQQQSPGDATAVGKSEDPTKERPVQRSVTPTNSTANSNAGGSDKKSAKNGSAKASDRVNNNSKPAAGIDGTKPARSSPVTVDQQNGKKQPVVAKKDSQISATNGGATKKGKSKGKTATAVVVKSLGDPPVEVKLVETKPNSISETLVVREVPEVPEVQPNTSEHQVVSPPPTATIAASPSVNFLAQQQNFNSTKENNPIGSTYGKTPGRERKEKHQGNNLNSRLPLPSGGKKVPLFQDISNDQNRENSLQQQMTDPWTAACRGLFGQDQALVGDHQQLNQMSGSHNTDRFVPNLNFNELPRDVSGLSNGHASGIGDQTTGNDVGNYGENPLGAIGTMPPVSKSYSLFDTENVNPLMQQAGYSNANSHNSSTSNSSNQMGGLSSQGYYNNNMFGDSALGYGQDLSYPLQQTNQHMLSAGIGSTGGFGSYGNGLDNMFNEPSRSSHDFFAEYQAHKQELQRLALLLALQQQQQQQQGDHHHLTGNLTHNSNNNSSPMSDYLDWDQQLLQQQLLQRYQQQQQQQQQRAQFSGRTGGPPPGIPARRSDGGGSVGAPATTNDTEANTSNGGDSSSQYDPFRSIWNQWNSNQ